jgi:hypothetical protein
VSKASAPMSSPKHFRYWMCRAVLLAAALVLFAATQACTGGPVGTICSIDTECAPGLQCFRPPMQGNSVGVCTIGCASEGCADGTCVQSDYGAVCAASCYDNADCPAGLSCQQTSAGPTVCWYEDTHFEKIPDTVRISKTVLVDDTNADGELNPGESARIQFFPVNLGQTKVDGLWAELLSFSHEDVTVQGCYVETPTDWVKCSASCSCEKVTSAAHISLLPGQGHEMPILEVTFDLAQSTSIGTVPFTVRIHDEFGRTWDHALKIPVKEIKSSVMIAKHELTSDTNGDGSLNPGEVGTIEITAQNPGETQVQGLYAELLSVSPGLEALACYAGVGESWVKCDTKCNCKDVSDTAKQTLEPSGVGDVPIYRIDFRLDYGVESDSVLFDVAFNDTLGLKWTGSAKLNVVPNEATLALSHIEIIDDANEDGLVSPQEPASIQVFAKNVGTSKATDVWASLLSTSQNVVVAACSVGIGDGWYPCDASCSCEDAMAASKQMLESGAIGDIAVLKIDFHADIATNKGEVSFQVQFHDESGNAWTDQFAVDVLPLDAVIEIGSTALLADDNSDGFLSPGEKVTVEVYPRNLGTSKAIGVFARITELDPLAEINTCFTFGKNKAWAQCANDCSCDVVDEQDRQDLFAESMGKEAILQINFSLNKNAPLQPLWFTVAFEDQFGNVWTDKFWVPVVSVKAQIAVDSATLWNDTNEDGHLSPGENVSIQVYAKNTGSTKTFGLYAELSNDVDDVEISSCYTQVDVTWAKCTSSCSCDNVSANATHELEPNEIGEEAIMRFNLYLKPTAPLNPLVFKIKFYDALGNMWEDAFYVDVEKHKAEISVAFSEVVGDTNGDGLLSPGESASLLVYPRNTGPVKAVDVWSALQASVPQATVQGCYASADGAWANCGADCSCDGLFESALQTLEPGKTSDTPILKLDFDLAHDSPVSPIGFGLLFYDKLGVSWNDSITVDVVEPDTQIQVGPMEIVNDYGSGVEAADGDGELSPGEFATLQIYAQNEGTANAMGVWSYLYSHDENVEIASCFVSNGQGDWAKCDQSCSCEYVFSSMKHDIDAGDTGNAVILQINFKLAPEVQLFPIQFVVGFKDAFYNEWLDGFTVPVVAAEN